MLPRLAFTVAALAASVAHAWLPGTKIRGVNLGSLFIIEPWMMLDKWAKMGCTNVKDSEFDCMAKLGQAAGNAAWKQHWETWIVESDFDEMVSSGINTVRIPLGYWMMEDIVYRDSEHFPMGGLPHLKRICGWASDRGMYIILELHGAPGAQTTDSFTGQKASPPGFFQNFQYDRATKFLAWLRNLILDTHELRNVGMIGVVNEPSRDKTPDSLRTYYYPHAQKAIRDVENDRKITPNNFVHIQFMNAFWGPANPTQFLAGTSAVAYDDHRYLKWALPDGTQQDYIRTSCNDNRSGDGLSPTIVGEWSISVPDSKQWTGDWHPNNKDFYKKWFAAQVIGYEKSTIGWIFWAWKAELGDYRWSYKDALAAGVIPKDLNSIASSDACKGV